MPELKSITPWEFSESYDGLSSVRNVYQIWFFEVRDGFRLKGTGRKFAQMLIEVYEPMVLIVFSAGADDF